MPPTEDVCATATRQVDHSVVLVGYGVDAVNGPYWKIKNSWSTAFANGGYINVFRGVGCAGICSKGGGACGGGNLFMHGDPASYYE